MLTATERPVPAPDDPARTAGRVLTRLPVLLALWVLLGTLAAVPLAAARAWQPLTAACVLLVALALAFRVAARIPSIPVSRWATVAVAVVAVGAGVWAGLTHAEQVVLRRDAGTYALSGQHLATAHRLSVDVDVPALGGAAVLAEPGVGVASPGFFQQGQGTGTHVVPQFLPATPVWLSVGWWLGGWTGLLLVPALALSAALLAFGALATRVVGPWWAVAATTGLAVSQPVLHAGRSTYSEPFALLVGCAGALLLVTAADRGRRTTGTWSRRQVALLAGLLVAGAALVRVDALREVTLLLPLAALLAVRAADRPVDAADSAPGSESASSRGIGAPVLAGLAVSVALAAAVAVGVSRPYLAEIGASLLPLLAAGVALGMVSVVVVVLGRRGRALPGAVLQRLPAVLAGLVVLAGAGLASRPLWQVVRQDPDDPGARVVAGLQQAQGLAVDGGRTYAEHTVQWVVWWVGVPLAVLALAGAAGAAHRVARAWASGTAMPSWASVAVVGFASTVLTLYRPGITPDHPWADRRLVPVVLPFVLLAGVAAARWGCAQVSHRPAGVRTAVALVAVVAVVWPAFCATWPVAGQRTERGEVAAVQRACRAFEPKDVAVLVDSRAANEWAQLLRGVCGVPAVVVKASTQVSADAAVVDSVSAAVRAAGRRPVLVAAGSPDALVALGDPGRQVVALRTIEDERLLTRRPAGSVRLDVRLWVQRLGPAPPAPGGTR